MLFCYFFFPIYFYFNFPIKSQLDAQSSSQNAVHSFIAYMSDGRLTKPQWILKQIALLPNVCFFFVKNFFYSHSLYAVLLTNGSYSKYIYIYLLVFHPNKRTNDIFLCCLFQWQGAMASREFIFTLYYGIDTNEFDRDEDVLRLNFQRAQ